MGAAEPIAKMTWDEYLAFEEASEERYELVNGEVYLVGAATPRHNRIAFNVARALDVALGRRKCVALPGSPQRVLVEDTGLACYPDALVVCGPPRYHGDGRTLLNPTLLAEVLSPTTADFDRGGRLRHFMRIPTFTDYLVIEVDEHRVEHHHRVEPRLWLMREHIGDDEAIVIEALGVTLTVGDFYSRVDEL